MKEVEMIEKFRNNSVPLYPYDGRSSYLIDKFYIFGYDYLTIEKYIINETPDVFNENIPLKIPIPFQLEEDPYTLAEITNDYNKVIIESELIQKRIFPNKINFYYTIKIDENKPIRKDTDPKKSYQFEKIDFSEERTGIPVSHRIVFSNNFVKDNNNRKCQNGFAYTFYRKFYKEKFYKNKKCTFYIPYTFCILSEFPYYQSFENLFRCIRRIFSQDSIYIPLEIILYKIVKLTPSPINSDVILDLELICNQEKVLNKINNKQEGIKKGFSAQINDKLNLDKGNKTKFDVFLEDFDIIEKKPINKIKFKYLSGYPMIQYNLAKVLFKTRPLPQTKSLIKTKTETEIISLSIEKIISIFLLTFLEEDLIIFSENIEYLTLFLQSFINFNYPYNDMNYYFTSGAISLESLQKGTNQFNATIHTNMIGIHNKFVPEYQTKKSGLTSHTVVDLDKGEIITTESDKSFIKIIELINNICSKKPCEKRLKETIIYQAVINLYKRLDKASQRKDVYSEKNFIYFSDEPDENNKESIEDLNKDIQEAFYDFIINISLYFYDNIKILEIDKNNKRNKNKKNNFYEINFDDNSYKNSEKYLEEESLILNKITDTMKFQGSFCTFAINHKPTDLFAIPLIFTEEFISFISNKRNRINTPNIKYFKLIDQLYLPKKDDKDKIIDFNSDINKFFKNYKNNFNKEIDKDDNNEFNDDDFSLIKIAEYKKYKILKYKTYELDDNILLKYINILFDLPEKQNLDLIKDNKEKDINELKKINSSKIETILEEFCLNNKVLSNTELCCANIIIIFSMSIKYLSEKIDCLQFLSVLFQKFYISRKYYSLLLNMINKIYKQSIEENNYNKVNQIKICFYACLDYIKKNKIIPDENIINIINKFTVEIEKKIEKNEIEPDDEINENENIIINEKNLQVRHNFSSIQFYNEKSLLKMINKTHKSYINVIINGKKQEINPKIIFFKNKKEIIKCKFYSQKVLLDKLTKEYNDYLKHIDIKKVNMKIIFESFLNIFLMIRNNNNFHHYDEIWKMLENIFDLFSNIE